MNQTLLLREGFSSKTKSRCLGNMCFQNWSFKTKNFWSINGWWPLIMDTIRHLVCEARGSSPSHSSSLLPMWFSHPPARVCSCVLLSGTHRKSHWIISLLSSSSSSLLPFFRDFSPQRDQTRYPRVRISRRHLDGFFFARMLVNFRVFDDVSKLGI